MNIGQMFAKPINRDIKPVVKPGQVDDATVKLELQEYVVTQELQKHFAEFFSNYRLGMGPIPTALVSGSPASSEVVNRTF